MIRPIQTARGWLTAIIPLVAATLSCGQLQLIAVTPVPDGQSTPTVEPTSTPTQAATPDIQASPIPLPTALPTPTVIPTPTPSYPWTTGEIRVYPGPLHYAGDVLTFEIGLENMRQLAGDASITLSIDNAAPRSVAWELAYSPLRANVLVLRWAWDTGTLTGLHQITVSIPNEVNTAPEILTTHVNILPASSRPVQERNARWRTLRTGCCLLSYLTGTAAARDILSIARQTDEDIAAIEKRAGFPVSGKPVPITLIDNVWGNGAYASAELVLTYVDRSYIDLDLNSVTRHEVAHWLMRPLEHETPTLLQEGVAVYLAGGHYKTEPIAERASALIASDLYIPLGDLTDNFRSHQHESAYIEAAGLVAYLTETYGWDQFLALYSAKDIGLTDSAWLNIAMQNTFGKSLRQIEQGYRTWLRAHPPGNQVDDLKLTIGVFDAIRQYQDLYAPYQESLPTAQKAIDAGSTAEFIREPTTPENIALEAMLIEVERALRENRYADGEDLLSAVNAALDTGDFTQPPTLDFYQIARLVADQGYEAQQISIADTQATVRAIKRWPHIDVLNLIHTPDGWQIAPNPEP